MKHFSIIAGALFATVAPAQAFQFTGGEVELNFSAYLDDTDFSRAALQTSVEAAFTRSFGVQLDVSAFSFGEIDDSSVNNVTLHGIYHLSGNGSLGLFLGQDIAEEGDIEFLGVEGGTEFGSITAEAYAGLIDGNDDGGMLGVLATFPITDRGVLIGSIDRIDVSDDVELTRLGVKVAGNFNNGIDLFAEVGVVDVDAFGVSDSEPFVGFGANFKIGADRGTTFGQRGIFNLFPGL